MAPSGEGTLRFFPVTCQLTSTESLNMGFGAFCGYVNKMLQDEPLRGSAAINFVTLIPGFKLRPCDIIWIGFLMDLSVGCSAFPGAKILFQPSTRTAEILARYSGVSKRVFQSNGGTET
ncbi:hypothetical protein RvY_12880 [Ramazzottius varieornatus]|uniref:Uncharacterized protein n=1 Tax=Ramazzottius varieornatus TaxID=947166 RepID=A0A1D1VMZ6_RAMVA|nr:hypothetical protein RvY_12880 [Ramazzottius varieornatus]